MPSATRGPHGMGDPLGPSGLLKASLNESNRQQMHQNVKLYNSLEFVYKMGIEAFNLLNFLSSQLLFFSWPHEASAKTFYYFISSLTTLFNSSCKRPETAAGR
jgi:hypothetical protein